ncbi:DUF4254 domain-containing protein [Nocardia brasiliensis]
MFVRDRALLATGATARPLPEQRELVAAFGDCPGDPATDHPLVSWARALGALHRTRRGNPLAAAGIDCRRAELVAAIDAWVAAQVPHRRYTEHLRSGSLGGAVDRMAAAHVHASHLLHTAEQVSDDRVHAAWYRLAQLADEWTDLIMGAVPARTRKA